MEYFIAFAALAAFGYFVYTRVVAARSKPKGNSEGGNEGGSDEPNTNHK